MLYLYHINSSKTHNVCILTHTHTYTYGLIVYTYDCLHQELCIIGTTIQSDRGLVLFRFSRLNLMRISDKRQALLKRVRNELIREGGGQIGEMTQKVVCLNVLFKQHFPISNESQKKLYCLLAISQNLSIFYVKYVFFFFFATYVGGPLFDVSASVILRVL